MSQFRIQSHPILPVPEREPISFTWQGKTLQGYANETIAAALFANGIRIFGYHPKDPKKLALSVKYFHIYPK